MSERGRRLRNFLMEESFQNRLKKEVEESKKAGTAIQEDAGILINVEVSACHYRTERKEEISSFDGSV